MLGASSDTGKRIAVGSNQDGRLEAFLIGNDDKVHHFWRTEPNGAWADKPSLLYIGTERILKHIWQMEPNVPTGWTGEKIVFGQNPGVDQQWPRMPAHVRGRAYGKRRNSVSMPFRRLFRKTTGEKDDLATKFASKGLALPEIHGGAVKH